MTQYNDSLYFVVTSDIEVKDELLVWYDEEQYNIYMGVPTGYREVPPHPLYAKQHTATQDSASELAGRRGEERRGEGRGGAGEGRGGEERGGEGMGRRRAGQGRGGEGRMRRKRRGEC